MSYHIKLSRPPRVLVATCSLVMAQASLVAWSVAPVMANALLVR